MSFRDLGSDFAFSSGILGTSIRENRHTFAVLKDQVSTFDGRHGYRIGHAAETGVGERLAAFFTTTTNYGVVVEDLKLQPAATLSYLVDASNPRVRDLFPALASTQRLTSQNRGIEPNHKILIEQHVYAFYWDPMLSGTFLAAKAFVSIAALAASVAGTVVTFGAAAPSLVGALQGAASTTSDVIKLYHHANEAAKQISEIKSAITDLKDAGVDAYESVGAALGGSGGSAVDLPTARTGAGPEGSMRRYKASLFSDLYSTAGAPRMVEEGSLWWKSTRPETRDETIARIRGEIVQRQAHIRKLMFAVVQRATPVIIRRQDWVDIGPRWKCTLTLDARTESVVRVGHSDLAKYERMMADMEYGDSDAPLLVNPWLGEAGVFVEYVHSHAGGTDAFSQDPYTVDWNPPTPPPGAWTRIAEIPGQFVEKPGAAAVTGLASSAARAGQLYTERAKGRAEERRVQEERRRREQAAAAAAARLQAAQLQASQQLQAIALHPLPTVREFIERTEIRYLGGMYTAARTNPLLLAVDTALENWFTVRAQVGGAVAGQRDRYRTALEALRAACADYIEQKAVKIAGGGSESQRLQPVKNLQTQADQLLGRVRAVQLTG